MSLSTDGIYERIYEKISEGNKKEKKEYQHINYNSDYYRYTISDSRSANNLRNVINEIDRSISYQDSVDSLIKILDTIDLEEMINNPKILFDLHEILTERADIIDVMIRFNIQTALFYQTIFKFGKRSHIQKVLELNKIRKNSQMIGAFALNEHKGGIMSDVFLETRIDYDKNRNVYLLNTKNNKSDQKTWITGGMFADHIIIFANVYADNILQSISPFFIEIRGDDGNLRNGITIEDMGLKNALSYLDCVAMTFDNIVLDSDSIMDSKPIQSILNDVLLVSRLTMSLTSLNMCVKTIDRIYSHYVSKKEIAEHISKDTSFLKDLPHIRMIFDRFNYNYRYGIILINKCIKEYVECSSNNLILSKSLIEKIDCAKIFCTETSRNTMYEIQVNLGSVSLLEPGADPSKYIYYTISFGDCGILRQRLAAESMIALQKETIKYIGDMYRGKRSFTELILILLLMLQIMIDNKVRGNIYEKAWLMNYENVMALSQVRVMHVVRSN